MKLSKKKLFLFTFLTLALGMLMMEGLCSILVLANDYFEFRRELADELRAHETIHTKFDSEIGWVPKEGTISKDHFGKGKDLTITSEGIRGLRTHGAKAAGVFRLVCLGDSFTQGYGVGDAESFPAQIEKLNPRVEAVNMGQGGYSVGQDYLWFLREGIKFSPDFVVFCVISDDFQRLESGTIGSNGAFPKFRLHSGTLEIYNQPVPADKDEDRGEYRRWKTARFFVQHDPIARIASHLIPIARGDPHAISDEAFSRTIETGTEIFRLLAGHLHQTQTGLAIVLLPTYPETVADSSISRYDNLSGRLLKFCQEAGIPFLDLKESFKAEAEKSHTMLFDLKTGHYTAAGYHYLAQRLNACLPEIEPRYPHGAAPEHDANTETR
ncbi:SGNH/GDSL hydrolase family protein [Candidatus Sumerlaeota bacterium]|nr:SGNH/GDSL hydrolase family protein [Candidatus Sumerlaeota bacterium]MBI3736159.1 SGNH/GDSL hydrolase family protein [Candidatus Sumerlaeota bacterium]